MKRYVICHMMPCVDGRLRTDRWDVPRAGHEEYERTADSYHADAWICGRKTMEEFASGRATPSAHVGEIPREDYVVARRRRGTRYAIAGDHPRLEGTGGTSRVMKVASVAEANAAERDRARHPGQGHQVDP